MKPCPFCSKPIDKDHSIYGVLYHDTLKLWIFNHTCNFDPNNEPQIDLTLTVYGKTKQEVVERWNNRAEVQESESL